MKFSFITIIYTNNIYIYYINIYMCVSLQLERLGTVSGYQFVPAQLVPHELQALRR